MVQILSFIGAMALLSSFAAGLPRPLPQDDSAIGIEVAVSAPDGIPITNTIELASQSAREAASRTAAPPVVTPGAANDGAEQQQPPKHEAPQVEQPQHEPPKQEAPAHVPVPVTTPVHTPVEQPAHTPIEQPAHTPVEQPAHTPVHTPEPAHPIPTHGSGSAPWSNQDYNDCVSKCIATYGQAPGQYKPTVTEQPHAGEAAGTGATHTVIVAPTQGVLRYIPFAVNASVGDTIKFMWGANNHTVTKSSALLPCNRTGEAVSFTSGIQNKDFVFTQVVNDTKPTYFFCNAPSHCQKGMFGIINPATQFASPSSVGLQMSKIAAKSANVAGYSDVTRQATKSNDAVNRWGNNIEMAEIPDWAHEYVAENVLYTRNFLAANPEVMKEDGSIDLSTASTVPLAIPQDVAAALNNAGSSGPSSSAPAEASTPAASTDAPTATESTESLNSGSSSTLASPKVVLAVVAVVATLLM